MKKKLLIAVLAVGLLIPAIFAGAELLNITAKGVDGDLVYYDASGNEIMSLEAANRLLTFPSGSGIDVESGASLKLGGTAITSSAAELNYLDITTIGTVQASKAIVVDSSSVARGGTFSASTISGGTFTGSITNSATITGGTLTSVTLSGAGGTLSSPTITTPTALLAIIIIALMERERKEGTDNGC